MKTIRGFLLDTRGATAIEYCMIAGSIALAIVTSMTLLGTRLNHFFQQIAAVN